MNDSVAIVEAHGETKENDLSLAKRVAEYLSGCYPGHPWLVGCNLPAGVVDIHLTYPVKIASRLGCFGHYIHIKSLSSEADWKKIMRAGGDLLERYNLARRAYKDGDWQKAAEHGLDPTGALK